MVNRLRLPTLTAWYEDYERSYESFTRNVFDFLELPMAQPLPLFTTGKSYESYFTDEERLASMKLLKSLMTTDAWALVERYSISM